jgi:hypothetical protein
MTRARLDRRTLLRGCLGGVGVALGLPLLEIMMTERAWAEGGGFPRRFCLFFWGNGNGPGVKDDAGNFVHPDRWTPTGTGSGSAWSLSEELAPLAAFKSKLAVVSGMSVKVPNDYPHVSGAAGLLSGAAPLNEALESFAAPTVDQIVAEAIGGDTLFRSLQTAATDTLGLSFSGPNARHPAEIDPYTLYGRLFGPTFVLPGEGGLVSPTLGLRRSVLDAVSGDLERLKGRLGAEDLVRVDQHLTGVRELEQRLARIEEDPPDLEACTRPPEPQESYPNVGDIAQVAPRNQAMAQILAMALACDQTRVVAHTLSEPVNNTRFEGTSDGHHNLTHDEPADQPQVHAITVQVMGCLADLLAALDAVPEGAGTLLDSCVVLAASEISLGRTHSLDEMPILLAGGAGGRLQTDLHYRSTGQDNASRVLLSVIRAMDVVAGEFGRDEGRVTDGLSAIEV